MEPWHTPSFAIYALFATGLCVFMIAIDGLAGGVRVSTKTTLNPEDAATVSRGAKLVESDPEKVARAMRVHRNALSNIVPFLFVMLIYVAFGAPTQWVLALCGAFAAARVIHAFAYLGAKQPWRTLSFVVGQACTVIAAVQVARVALAIA